MNIQILDSVECAISKRDGEILKGCLSFEAVYWQQGPRRKIRKTYQKDVFSFKGKERYLFYTGLLPRVLKWCERNNIETNIIGQELRLEKQADPFLKGITFRDDQLRLINAACEFGRGVIVAPTGAGKTIMQLGLMSCYPKYRFLLLAHTTGITTQTFKKLKEFGFKDIEMFGAGNKAKKPSARITISTIQSFIKIKPKDFIDYYDGIIIDECHHVQSMKSNYTKVLSRMVSPLRWGFTATKKETDEAIFVNEGLLGKTIAEVTTNEAAELGILAKPKLKLIRAKCSKNISEVRKYQDTFEKITIKGQQVNGNRTAAGVYTFGIVENELRNTQIIEVVEKFIKNDKTTLIFVTKIDHGKILVDMFKRLDIKVPFVQGSMDENTREKVKNLLMGKKLKVCIATSSWTEGIDIPSINNIVLASAGKSEIQLLQRLGRGLRKDKGKEFVTIVDFLDLDHPILTKQTGERLAVYSKKGWL